MDAEVSSWACTLSKYSANAVDCGAMWYIFGNFSWHPQELKQCNLGSMYKCMCMYMYVCMCVCVCVCVCEHGFNMER